MPFGEAAFVIVSSAPADAPTIVEAEAVLLLEFGSLTEELAEAVSVITVPFAVPVFTFVISEKVAAVPPAILRSVQTTLPVLPTGGVVQVQPAGAAMETNVVLVGTASTRVVLSAALGPLLVRTCVKVMLLPAATGLGDAVLVMLRSAMETTLATSVALSFAKLTSPPPLTNAVLVSVDGAVCNTLAVTVIEG